MAKTIEHKKFVCADALNNNNKFWEYLLRDDGTVIVIYGRVGKTRNEDDPKPMTRKELDAKIREKLKGSGKEGTPTYKPPYREIAILAEKAEVSPTGPALTKEVVRAAAKKQLGNGDSTLSKLVERLVEANKHELVKASGGQIDIDLKTGIISTPIGVITKDTVTQARDVLNKMDEFVQKKNFDDKKFIAELNNYLMLVPQTVGHRRGWHTTFFTTHNTLQHQNTLLDQLEASADLAEARVNAAKNTVVQTTLADTPNIFNADLKVLSDVAMIKKIEKMFFESINDRHESRHMKPIRFYEVTLPDAKSAFDQDGAKLSNIMMLWHGTRMFNVLSILKNGFLLPKAMSTMQICGAMFGKGLYFSDQSSKSLNYSRGYWDGGPRDKNCFMLLADVATGKSYVPKGSYETLPKPGYDSTFAKAGQSGVLNNEIVVYRISQTNIRYLVEFEEK